MQQLSKRIKLTSNPSFLFFLFPSLPFLLLFSFLLSKNERILLSRVLLNGGAGTIGVLRGTATLRNHPSSGKNPHAHHHPPTSGRYCSSFEVSPSSFRYYSTSVEYLTGRERKRAQKKLNLAANKYTVSQWFKPFSSSVFIRLLVNSLRSHDDSECFDGKKIVLDLSLHLSR